jgi:hypothetical protein
MSFRRCAISPILLNRSTNDRQHDDDCKLVHEDDRRKFVPFLRQICSSQGSVITLLLSTSLNSTAIAQPRGRSIGGGHGGGIAGG